MKRLLVFAGAGAVLAIAVAAPAFAGGGGGCHHEATDASGQVIRMAQSCFGPTNATVSPGTPVVFVNDDPFPHTVTGLGWGSPVTLPGGARASYTFDEPGVYPYACILHPGMVGSVVVSGDHAPSGADPLGAPPPAAVEQAQSVASDSMSSPESASPDPVNSESVRSVSISWAFFAAVGGAVLGFLLAAATKEREKTTPSRIVVQEVPGD